MQRIISKSITEWGPYIIENNEDIESLLIYMPAPISMPQIEIPSELKLPGVDLPIHLVFGASGNGAGRVVGMGFVDEGGRHQIWRMDYHPIHLFGDRFTAGGDASVWSDYPFHYHVGKSPFDGGDDE